jgi:hypothetical protein
MRLFLRCFVSAALLGSASAQLPFDPDEGTSIDWPTGAWGAGNVSRMLAGDFTGDLYRDLVLLEGDDLVLSFGPAVFTWRTHLGTDVDDACVVRNAVQTGFDGLIASDGSGLLRIRIDYSQSNSIVSSAVPNSSSNGWAGAQCLQTLLPASGVPTIVGISADGHSVLRVTNPFGSSPAYGSVASFPSTQVLAVAVVNWDNSGAPDVAVLHDAGLKVYSLAPATVLETYVFAADAGFLVAFKQDGFSKGRLAAVVQPPGVSPELRVFDDDETETDTLGIGSNVIDGAYALAAGDFDGDGSDEIVVAHQDSRFDGPVVFTNLCTSTSGSPCDTFDISNAEVLDLGVSWTTPTPLAKPVLDDLTSDGDLDVAWFQQGDALLRLAENTTKNHTAQFIGIKYSESEVRYDLLDLQGMKRSLFTTFEVPPEPDPEDPPLFAFTPTHILIEEWFEGSEPLELDPVGVLSFIRTYPGPTFQGPVTKDMMLWPIDDLTTGLVHLTIRAIRTESGALVAAGPASTYTIAQGSDAWEYLQTLSFPTSSLTVRSWDLPYFSGSLPNYIDGPFTDQNASEGSGAGKPPRPPPGLDEQEPPKSPIHS